MQSIAKGNHSEAFKKVVNQGISYTGAEIGAAAGATISTFLFPGVGTVIGGIVGGFIGGYVLGKVGEQVVYYVFEGDKQPIANL